MHHHAMLRCLKWSQHEVMLLAYSGQRPGMLLDVLQCIG
jgi:hypothetical protein